MASVAPDLESGNGAFSQMNGSTDYATEKLALMKLRSATLNGSEFGGHASSNGAHGSSGMLRAGSTSNKALTKTKTTRHSSSASRRNSSFIAGHRSKMAAEMTIQAENKFFSLMDLMSAASKEASSLKEIWGSLMADRESFNREREELLNQIDEYSEIIETKDSDHSGQYRELADRKKEMEKLVIQVTTAMAAVTEQQQKVAQREHQLQAARKETTTVQSSMTTLQHSLDQLKFDYDASRSTIIERESERDSARIDADRQRGEVRTVSRENSELKSKVLELTSHLDQSRKENALLTERSRAWERERADFLYEKDRIQEELRRMTSYRDEASRELQDAIDRSDSLQRELHKVRETVRHVELERDEHVTTIDRLRHDNTHKNARLTEIEALYAEVTVKLEQSKREVTDKLERVSFLEIELLSLRTQVDAKQEEWRLVVVDRDNAKDDLEIERRKVADTARQVISLQEHVSRSDMAVSEHRAATLRITETLRETERERDAARQVHGPLQYEIASIKEKLAVAIAETETLVVARDRVAGELDDLKYQYEEVTETMTEWNSDSDELRMEIESMRTLIKDLREHKERAIAARLAADRERDDCVQRYEEKCRQVERLEESKASALQQSWESNNKGRSTSSRVTSKSTVINHGEHHGHGHGHSQVETEEL